MCGSMADIQSAAAEIRRGKEKKEEEQTTGRKCNGLPYSIGWPQKGRIATAIAHGRFNRIRQVQLIMCIPSNTCVLGPTQVHNPHPKWHFNQLVQPFLHSSWRVVVVVTSVCLQPFGSDIISWVQSLQPPPPWTVGSCWQYVTSFGVCHKGTCRFLQRPTSFDSAVAVAGLEAI